LGSLFAENPYEAITADGRESGNEVHIEKIIWPVMYI
jgi:hypothetical protein